MLNVSNRIKFFLGHLAISLLVALIAVSIVFFVWYPAPLAKAVGVTHIFLMLLAIDVIVGPLLTLLVYKDGKKTLKFDLTVIALLQASALLYGTHAIAQGRPAWIVFYVDRFDLVSVNEILDDRMNDAAPEFQQKSLLGPKYATVLLSSEPKQRTADTFEELTSGRSLAQRPERYQPISQATAIIKSKTQDLSQLEVFNSKAAVHKITQQYPQANGWLPLRCFEQDMVVLMNKDTAQVVKIVDLRPWN